MLSVLCQGASVMLEVLKDRLVKRGAVAVGVDQTWRDPNVTSE